MLPPSFSSESPFYTDRHMPERRNRIRHRTGTHRGYEILKTMDGLIRARKGERDLSYAPGRIYAISSGMMTENTEGQTR